MLQARGFSGVRFLELPGLPNTTEEEAASLPNKTEEEAAVEGEKTVDEEKAQVKESCTHKNDEGTARLEGSCRNMEPSERHTQLTCCSYFSWLLFCSLTPSDSLSVRQEPRRRHETNIIAHAISRSFHPSETPCDICLMDCRAGQEVRSSPNEECVHVFFTRIACWTGS